MLFQSRIRCVHSDVHWHGLLCDKYMVKKIATELNIHGLHVPKTFQIVEHCSDLDYNKLPEHFVMNPPLIFQELYTCAKSVKTQEKHKIRDTNIRDRCVQYTMYESLLVKLEKVLSRRSHAFANHCMLRSWLFELRAHNKNAGRE